MALMAGLLASLSLAETSSLVGPGLESPTVGLMFIHAHVYCDIFDISVVGL